ncbi:MAG TPA: NUDIX domain-containing protein [Candidatus Saccharimonadales bacterium]|nr:NUDIX domain-containing protein [Candidatus Saccharimonadales bacterium]
MNNPNPRIGSYIEPGYAPKPVFVDDGVYTQILDAIVVACLDIVLVHEGKILLGKRAWHPQADWWIIGGRMRPGEELEVAAARHAKRDLGLELPHDRFSYLTSFSTAWKVRRHAPADHGTHTTSIVMVIELTTEEAESIKLNEEYTEQQWLAPADILANVDFHPALHQCALALAQDLRANVEYL